MKRIIPIIITIGLSLLLALFSAAITYSSPSQAQKSLPDSAYLLQATPTPPQEDRSEIGSTDEIAIMGGVIALIIIVPILMKRSSWR